MTTEEKIKQLVGGDFLCKCACCEMEGQDIDRPITLADVLRAIGKNAKAYRLEAAQDSNVAVIFVLSTKEKFGSAVWNLALDYDGQTQEMKEFIGRLLNVTI